MSFYLEERQEVHFPHGGESMMKNKKDCLLQRLSFFVYFEASGAECGLSNTAFLKALM